MTIDHTFKIPLYLLNAMKKAASERGQSLVEYVDDLGAALLLGDQSIFKGSNTKEVFTVKG